MSDLHEAAQEQETVIRETVAFLRKEANGWDAGRRSENNPIAKKFRAQADKLERVCGLGENAEVKR